VDDRPEHVLAVAEKGDEVRILVVDDSRTMRLILRRMLAELGQTDVQEAEHGLDALRKLVEPLPDLALVDWNMPEMNGLEFLKAVREVRAYDSVKLMVVTSESSPRIVYDALKAGADEYAMKPITAAVIDDKLQLLGLT
jgi:two-component system chemotaxis response regulator CheY